MRGSGFLIQVNYKQILGKNMKIYCVFMDPEKAYDVVERDVLLKVLKIFGLETGDTIPL